MAKLLTKRQEMILQYILDYVQREGYPPSIREIGKDFDIGSLRGVTVHLDALTRKGYISRSNTPRSIKVVHEKYQTANQFTMLPLLGSIAAGTPIHAQESVEDHLPVPYQMVRSIPDAFLLRIKGDSMIGDGILPRDLVVIKPQKTANQGELVAFQIEDEATVKRISFEAKGIKLISSNPAYAPIEVTQDRFWVIGKVVGLIRDYEGRAF